jgi:ADP-heptose:LPS heptosyltransferase
MMKILVVRFSSIGDIVLTSPVVRCLRQQLDAEVHFLTKQSFKDVVAQNPYITKVHTIQKNISEVIDSLRAESFNFVADLHHNLRSAELKLRLVIPGRSFRKLNMEKWLRVHTPINLLPNVHIVDRYLDTVRHLGIMNDGIGLDYFIPENDEIFVRNWLVEKKIQRYIAFVIGAAHSTKRLPEERIIEICHKIPFPVVLLGGREEVETGTRIVNAAGPHIFNACGSMSLHRSAALLRHAEKVISHDTGLMHIAAALGKEILAIWGNTIPEFGMTPYYPEGMQKSTNFEVSGLSCRPCSKIGFSACPKGHFRCMREMNPEVIVHHAIL